MGFVPIRLSSSAQANGWTEIVKLPPQSWASHDLQNFFERDFYDGQTAQQKLAEPMSLAGLVLVLLLVGLLYLRSDIAEESREFYKGLFGDDPIVDIDALKQVLIGRLLHRRYKPIPYIHSKPTTDSVRLAATPAVTPVLESRKRASDRMDRAASETESAKQSVRPIFPGTRPSSKPNQPWDESQWIE